MADLLAFFTKITLVGRESSILGRCYCWRCSVHILDESRQWASIHERGPIQVERCERREEIKPIASADRLTQQFPRHWWLSQIYGRTGWIIK